MDPFQEMYVTLFRKVTKAIDMLQRAQKTTEEIYLAGADEIENDKLEQDSYNGRHV